MEVVGEEGISLEDMQTYLKGELYDFCYLQQNSFDKEDSYCPLDRQMTSLGLMGKILDQRFFFKTHDEVREFFLALQHRLKNLNYLPLGVATYTQAVAEIEAMLNV
jgi:V/A-type H+/Na+-transporting ATPase subunit A